MKKLIGLLLIFSASSLSAEQYFREAKKAPAINSHVSEAVYIATYVPNQTANVASSIISTRPVALFGLTVGEMGSTSKLEIYNARVSSFGGIVDLKYSIDTSTLNCKSQSYVFNVDLSSGLIIRNYVSSGTSDTAAKVTLTYKPK